MNTDEGQDIAKQLDLVRRTQKPALEGALLALPESNISLDDLLKAEEAIREFEHVAIKKLHECNYIVVWDDEAQRHDIISLHEPPKP